MQQIGIYEQLITQIVAAKIDHQQFYIEERQLEPAEAATWLSRFLSYLIEYAVNAIPNSENQLEQQIALANNLLRWLKTQIQDEDLIFSQSEILKGNSYGYTTRRGQNFRGLVSASCIARIRSCNCVHMSS